MHFVFPIQMRPFQWLLHLGTAWCSSIIDWVFWQDCVAFGLDQDQHLVVLIPVQNLLEVIDGTVYYQDIQFPCALLEYLLDDLYVWFVGRLNCGSNGKSQVFLLIIQENSMFAIAQKLVLTSGRRALPAYSGIFVTEVFGTVTCLFTMAVLSVLIRRRIAGHWHTIPQTDAQWSCAGLEL
jgi:hypothetical protein